MNYYNSKFYEIICRVIKWHALNAEKGSVTFPPGVCVHKKKKYTWKYHAYFSFFVTILFYIKNRERTSL